MRFNLDQSKRLQEAHGPLLPGLHVSVPGNGPAFTFGSHRLSCGPFEAAPGIALTSLPRNQRMTVRAHDDRWFGSQIGFSTGRRN